jgi:hypothetical protein
MNRKKPNLNQVACQRVLELGSYTVAGAQVSKCGSGFMVKSPLLKNVKTFASVGKAVTFARNGVHRELASQILRERKLLDGVAE